jgi:hypothetical protein
MAVIAKAAESGDRLETLIALRDRLAVDLDACQSARDVAALSQRLMDVLEQVDTLQHGRSKKVETPLDELKKRRAQRVAGA